MLLKPQNAFSDITRIPWLLIDFTASFLQILMSLLYFLILSLMLSVDYWVIPKFFNNLKVTVNCNINQNYNFVQNGYLNSLHWRGVNEKESFQDFLEYHCLTCFLSNRPKSFPTLIGVNGKNFTTKSQFCTKRYHKTFASWQHMQDDYTTL